MYTLCFSGNGFGWILAVTWNNSVEHIVEHWVDVMRSSLWICPFLFSFWVSMLQHYMLNSEINEQLASAACVGEGDVVLEIGPGTGSLTNVLIDTGAIILAIEKVGWISDELLF